jgi:hypothetical protein
MPDRKLIIKSEYERIVFGEVYIPGQEDTDGNIMTADEIKKSCYNFMKNQRTHNIDMMHNYQSTGSYIVENFIARKNDPDDFIEGSWVAGTKIESDEVWDKILKGDLNCYSLAGFSKDLDKKIDTVKRVIEATGETFSNLDEIIPPHTHSFSVKFDDSNKVIPAFSGERMGHTHRITSTSVTDQSFGHSHRYVSE